MEAVKNYVVNDSDACWDDCDDNWKAIPAKYKTLKIYTIHAIVYGIYNTMRDLGALVSAETTLSIIVNQLDCKRFATATDDRKLIIKWLFEMFEPTVKYDVETGEWFEQYEDTD